MPIVTIEKKIYLGCKIWFRGEKQGYTVQALNERFVICNKPFNAQKTVLYTIIDLQKNIRGPENLIFGMGAETKEECEEMLARLMDTEDPSEVSHRHFVELDIINVK